MFMSLRVVNVYESEGGKCVFNSSITFHCTYYTGTQVVFW